jgi:hypothetical protein
VEYLGNEHHFGCGVGVLLCELHLELEDAAVPDRVLGAEDYSVPKEDVIRVGTGVDAVWRVVLQHYRVGMGSRRTGVGANGNLGNTCHRQLSIFKPLMQLKSIGN